MNYQLFSGASIGSPGLCVSENNEHCVALNSVFLRFGKLKLLLTLKSLQYFTIISTSV